MKKSLKKIVAATLTIPLAFCMVCIGPSGTSSVQAADNKAFAAPVRFPGARPEDDWDSAGTRLGIDLGEVGAFSDKYTFSYSILIPKAALEGQKEHAQVQVNTWFDFSQGETYLGNVQSGYSFLIVHDNGSIFPVVVDEQKGQELKASEYKDFFAMREAGDFYKLTVTDAPVNSMLNIEGDEQNQTAIDTSQSGSIFMQTRITGMFNKLASVVYLDDLSLKADGTVVFETDFSAADMHDRYYEYVLGEEKDENRKERPVLADLNTSLLKLDRTAADIRIGKTWKIRATAAADAKITYKTSNKKVATVTSKGVVKGIKAGKATLTVSANGISKKVKVTVKK